MKRIAIGLAVVSIVISTSVYANDARFGDSQADMTAESCDLFQRTDKKLTDLYQSIVADPAYADKPNFLAALKAAQVQWIKYRAAEREALFPDPDKAGSYGSAYPMCDCAAMTDITQHRIDELKVWAKGVQDGDVCTGSRKVRS